MPLLPFQSGWTHSCTHYAIVKEDQGACPVTHSTLHAARRQAGSSWADGADLRLATPRRRCMSTCRFRRSSL
jgi:hypothetical protein